MMSKLLDIQSHSNVSFYSSTSYLTNQLLTTRMKPPSTSIQAVESLCNPVAKELLTNIERVLLHRVFLARKLKAIE